MNHHIITEKLEADFINATHRMTFIQRTLLTGLNQQTLNACLFASNTMMLICYVMDFVNVYAAITWVVISILLLFFRDGMVISILKNIPSDLDRQYIDAMLEVVPNSKHNREEYSLTDITSLYMDYIEIADKDSTY